MNKKEKGNPKEARKKSYEASKMNTPEISKKKNDKDLPWWVELLFVQIGLSDKLLIYILKTKKRAKEIVNNDKKSLFTILFVIASFIYFYPVIKHAKNKLECEKTAKNYIINNKNLVVTNKMQLKMLSTNFCYGGQEIYEIDKSKN